MGRLIFASLSHTHYWYGVGMLKVPADFVEPRKLGLLLMLLYAFWRKCDEVFAIGGRHRIARGWRYSILYTKSSLIIVSTPLD